MKKHSKIIINLTATTFAVFLAGCAGLDLNKLAKEQQLKTNPSPLELHGDSVKFDMSAIVPVKTLKKNKIYTVNVDYKAFENRVNAGKIVFNGNDFPQAATETPTMSGKFGFAYADNLKKGIVVVVGEMADLNKPGKKTPEITVTSGIITTPLLVQPVYPTAMADHGYDNREELQPTVVNFYFQKRIAKLDAKETKGSRAKFFEKFIATKYVTRTVNIVGTHSPEGFEAYNEKLSEQRALTIEKYYRETMKKFNYGKVADSITFVVKGKVKDWNDFKMQLDSLKKLKPEQKQEILSIVDGEEGTFHQKELKLQKLKSYRMIEKEIYPKLRNAQTEVLTVKPKKSDAQIFIMAKNMVSGTPAKGDTLNAKELLYAATLTPSPEEQEAILTASSKRDDSYEAFNNLGALYLENAKKQPNRATQQTIVDQALTKLEIAKNKKEGAEVYLNMASAKLMKGDKMGAKDALASAAKFQPNAEVNKGLKGIQGVLDIKAGTYDAAIQNLLSGGSDAQITFDRGLALLLKKDNQSAKSAIDEAISKDANQAVFHYTAAIAAARLADIDGVNTNLKNAFKLDDSMKRKALDDLEFLNVKENEKFKDALK
ncbi:MAG: hypothetical protein ACKVOU_11605 [Cytophagales bacterium]